jgi:hypothetical protein
MSNPATCRTTAHCDGLDTITAPNSDTRAAAEENANGAAGRLAATAPTTPGARPRSCGRFDAGKTQEHLTSRACDVAKKLAASR